MAFKKYKNTAILNDEKVIQKDEKIDFPVKASTNIIYDNGETYATKHNLIRKAQVLELPDSDWLTGNSSVVGLTGLYSQYGDRVKSITIIKGRNTVIEIFK